MKIRYYGHIGIPTGYGKAAEGMCMALLAAGVELDIRPLLPYEQVKVDTALPLARCIRRDFELDPNPDAVIVHTLPMDCARVISHTGLDPDDVPFVAYTTWEGASAAPPAMVAALEAFDIVWTPSEVNAASFAAGGVARVQVMPHAFDEIALAARRGSQDVSFDDGNFRFYYFGAWTTRKNPEGVLRAYTRAFDKSDKVMLVLRSTFASEDEFAMAWYRTGFTKATSPPIIFGCKPVTDAAIVKLHRDCDCFVTATRGEAWNLPAFEAMLAGRHIIAPRGMGSDEFLHGTSAALYPSYLAPAGCDVRIVANTNPNAEPGSLQLQTVGAQEQTTRTDWREPDINALAEAMYIAYKGRVRDIAVSYDVAERFGYKSVGARALKLLEAL